MGESPAKSLDVSSIIDDEEEEAREDIVADLRTYAGVASPQTPRLVRIRGLRRAGKILRIVFAKNASTMLI